MAGDKFFQIYPYLDAFLFPLIAHLPSGRDPCSLCHPQILRKGHQRSQLRRW